jgi:hypothetical protein
VGSDQPFLAWLGFRGLVDPGRNRCGLRVDCGSLIGLGLGLGNDRRIDSSV